MSDSILIDRITRAKYMDTPEDLLHIKKIKKLAANGAIPYDVREAMKHHGWHLLSSTSGESEIGKLLIIYSWWARALENGIPKSKFEEFMNDHLAYLDAKSTSDKDAGQVIEKWQKYG